MRTPAKSDIVLAVDDSPETLGFLGTALEEAGLMVLVARDGTKALELVERVVPDIILLDAVMPELDGFETCRRLKQRPHLAHVPVIFMTGLSETEHIVKGLNAGGVDYVTKPIVPDELVARIGVHIANARLAHSARTALDVAGRSLMAITREFGLLWWTPQANALCERAGYTGPDASLRLPANVRAWVDHLLADPSPQRNRLTCPDEDPGGIRFTFIGQTGTNEYLFRVTDAVSPKEDAVLQAHLTLTPREAEVLLWISQGKSNRDIGDILGLSPRTVNKHLEQIFAKLGVENRTAAAALAVRTIVSAASA